MAECACEDGLSVKFHALPDHHCIATDAFGGRAFANRSAAREGKADFTCHIPPLLVLVKRFMAVIKCSEAARAVIKDYLPKIPGHNRASIIGIRPAFTFIKVKFRLGKAGRQQEGNPKTSRLICFRP